MFYVSHVWNVSGDVFPNVVWIEVFVSRTCASEGSRKHELALTKAAFQHSRFKNLYYSQRVMFLDLKWISVFTNLNFTGKLKNLRNPNMMQRVQCWEEPSGTFSHCLSPSLPSLCLPLSLLSLSGPSPSATAVARPNRHSNWQWTQRRGDNYSWPLGNFSEFQFLLFRIHQAPSARAQVWHLPPPPRLSLLGVFLLVLISEPGCNPQRWSGLEQKDSLCLFSQRKSKIKKRLLVVFSFSFSSFFPFVPSFLFSCFSPLKAEAEEFY